MSEKEKPVLPKGLEYKRAITDYLTEIETVATYWPNVNFMEQVLLIITVSAEFSEQANASIRECAYKAGCHYILYENIKEHMITEVGSSFMIVDCGGGIVDLMTCELLENNRLGEITECSDDFYRGTYADKEFIKFLKQKVGDSAVNLLYENHYSQLQYMVQEFCHRVKLLFIGNRKDLT
ncbi:41925_t:CDS:2 [Gigaspora margarita]|uniref:41925_t:CDS:1 n=1 Tax=Gigaspora margarita TaxID=4874 RepID=A0ABN7UER2_GIGMA|nr:41925_t:CDS:2 [Gigaspora margarita]